ncbi:hypothetical protein [Paenibacillus gorillae]|uniref:hypothetical protein n=1 Tax=Paenibacillus gorillae TaxID=1243662 RepID=UPI0004B7B38E|nr:hypothetical protein [Paenibacillus gorillae]
MSEQLSAKQLREAIEKLFLDAGYTVPGMLPAIDALIKDNDRLKQELKKLRLAAARGSSLGDGMNSRLKDALRE